jgi:tRNA modification GTPase
MDTIYALATARGRAGVAVVRVSGPLASEGLLPLVGQFAAPRQAALRVLRDGAEVLDQALVIRFAAGQSFTGEEVVELHLHGSPAVVQAVLGWLGARSGFRLAEPGEFTRRALENGRLDLAQVEGLSDLIVAETEAQRRQAMRLFSGELGQRAERWRSGLLRAAALLEAVLDFADEEVPVDVRPEVIELVDRVLSELRQERAGFPMAERIRDGFEVAIVGSPNAGKSTLLNRLAGRQAALTSEHAGTTRDVIEVRMDLAGLAVTLLDTAGLRDTLDPVEALGIEKARERAESADLRVFLLAPGEDAAALHPQADDLVVRGKADLADHGADGLAVSGLTGSGIDRLVERIGDILSLRTASAATITRVRHRLAVEQAIEALELARDVILRGGSEELAADSLRLAIDGMDDLVGRIGIEDMLGEIFSSFCIGK